MSIRGITTSLTGHPETGDPRRCGTDDTGKLSWNNQTLSEERKTLRFYNLRDEQVKDGGLICSRKEDPRDQGK